MGNKSEIEIIISKIGTDTLIRDGQVDMDYAANIAEQVWTIRNEGIHTVLVSSGAGALGGQEGLTAAWRTVHAEHGLVIEEILFEENAIDKGLQRVRKSLADGKIPLINGVSSEQTDERTGNNDTLAAIVAKDLEAHAVFLTTTDGVLDTEGFVLPVVSDVRQVTVFNRKSLHGTGGMGTKIRAGMAIAQTGRRVAIANGRKPDIIKDFAAGRQVGTGITRV